ncbi:MAG: DUF4388 domain-containing protein, partial [Planctomycetota bacterium]
MIDSGTIQEGSIANLISQAATEGASGVLSVRHENKSIDLLLHKGQVALHAVDGQKAIRIGEILLQRDRITAQQLNEALQNQKKVRKRLGEILVDMGAIQTEEVDRAIQIQVEEELFELFAWQEGEFEFSEGRPEGASWSRETFEAERLVEESISRLKEWREITRSIRDDREIFVLERDERETFLESLPDGLDRDLLMELTGEADITDLVNRLLVPRFKVYRILGKYLDMGRIRRPTLEELKTAGSYMRKERQPKTALKLLERAFDLFPGDMEVVEGLAEIYEEAREKRRAAAFYKILAVRYLEGGDKEKGLDICRKITEIQPNDGYACEHLYEDARTKRNRDALVENGRSLVKIYHSRKEYDKAASVGMEVLEASPSDIPLRQRIINIFLEAGNIEGAIEQFEALENVFIGDPSMDGEEKDRELFRVYDKILRLDASRKDVRRKLDAVRARLPEKQEKVEQKRFVTGPRILIVVALLAGLATGGVFLYQNFAEKKFEALEAEVRALVEEGKLEEAAEKYGEYAISYPWTPGRKKAVTSQEQIQKKLRDMELERRRVERTAQESLAEGAALLEKGEMDEAEAIFQEVLEGFPQGSIHNEALALVARVKTDREDRKKEKGEEHWGQFRYYMGEARECRKAKEAKGLFGALNLLDRALKELSHIESLGLEDWAGSLEKSRNEQGEAVRTVEKELQKWFAKEGLAEWGRPEGDLRVARDWLEKARALNRDAAVHAKVIRALQEIEAYEKKAVTRAEEIEKGLENLERLGSEQRKERMEECLSGTINLMLKYPKSSQGREAMYLMYVETEPPGCRVIMDRGRTRDPVTPTVLYYPPGARGRVRVDRKGYTPVEFETDGKTSLRSFRLAKSFLWKHPVGGAVQGQVTPWGPVIFSGNRNGSVHAVLINPKTGGAEPVWVPYKVEDFSGIKASVEVSRSILLLCTASKGEVHALDTGTGLPRWEGPYRTGRMIDHKPIVDSKNGTIYLGDLGGNVHALDLETGVQRWVVTLSGEKDSTTICSAPALFPGLPPVLFIPLSGGDVIKLNGETGKELWRITAVPPDPWMKDVPLELTRAGDLLLANRGQILKAFPTGDTPPARALWFKRARGGAFSNPLVVDDMVVVAEEGGILSFRDRATGERLAQTARLPGIHTPLRPQKLGRRTFVVAGTQGSRSSIVAVEK